MPAPLDRALGFAPAPLRRLATPHRLDLLRQFMAFGAVGTIGFFIDTAVVYALRGALGLYGAGVAAYVVAATGTWAMNRAWTFRGRGTHSALRQWSLFLLANMGGFVLNRGTYAVLVTVSTTCAEHPVLAVAAGCIAGMFINFALSRRVVFGS